MILILHLNFSAIFDSKCSLECGLERVNCHRTVRGRHGQFSEQELSPVNDTGAKTFVACTTVTIFRYRGALRAKPNEHTRPKHTL
jgi:hypothetical protein